MERRTLKQLTFGTVYLLIIFSIISSFYFWIIKPAPSCRDGKQNQNEEGIDCGGVCGTVCLPSDLQPISAIDGIKIFSPTSDKITLLGQLKNSNSSYGADVSYTIRVYDKSKKMIADAKQRTFLYPNQIIYVIVPSISLSGSSSAAYNADITFDKTDWQPAESLYQPQIIIRDQEATRQDGFISVQGSVINNGVIDIPELKLLAVFFGQFRNPVGAAQTELLNVTAGETRKFTIIYPDILGVQLQRTQVFSISN